MMKKLVPVLIFLTVIPSLALANNAAPYTEEALQNVVEAMKTVPRNEPGAELAKEEFFKQTLQYYTDVFSSAGYSFTDTINQIVDDMKNNPDAIPRNRQSVYNNLYIMLNIMVYECRTGNEDCLGFFPPETRESMQWFMENSDFNKQEGVHHGLK